MSRAKQPLSPSSFHTTTTVFPSSPCSKISTKIQSKNIPISSNNVFNQSLPILKQAIRVQLTKNWPETFSFFVFGRTQKPRPNPYLDLTILQLNSHTLTKTPQTNPHTQKSQKRSKNFTQRAQNGRPVHHSNTYLTHTIL